jgi:hypothetical protein
VYCLAVSPDGKLLASGGNSSVVSFWDLATGRLLRRSAEHQGSVMAMAFAPDGKTLASAAGDQTIHLWNPATGREVVRLAKHPDERVAVLAFSPDGKVLASGGGVTVCLWDAATGRELHRLPFAPATPRARAGRNRPILDVRALAFSPDGRTLAGAGHQKTIRLWEVATGAVRGAPEVSPREVSALAFLADGRALVCAIGDGTLYSYVRVWDLAADGEARHFGRVAPDRQTLANGVSALLLAAGGRVLVTGGWDQKLRLWDLGSGKLIREFRAEPKAGNVQSLALTPDGKLLASASAHQGTIFLWDPGTGEELRRLDGPRVGLPQGEGAGGLRLPAVRLKAGEAEALWADLAGADAARAYRAVCRLAAAPAEAAPLLRRHLRPAPPAAPGRLARLIADLRNERFAVREEAMAELRKLGEAAAAALARAAEADPSAEVRRRAAQLLGKGWKAALTPEGLRQLRAVEALEQMATPAARDVLRVLAEGAPGARLTREARASLERLARGRAAGK